MCWTVSRSRRQLPSREFCDLPEEEEKEGKILFIKNFWIRLYDWNEDRDLNLRRHIVIEICIYKTIGGMNLKIWKIISISVPRISFHEMIEININGF